jgi:hypothetical protein
MPGITSRVPRSGLITSIGASPTMSWSHKNAPERSPAIDPGRASATAAAMRTSGVMAVAGRHRHPRVHQHEGAGVDAAVPLPGVVAGGDEVVPGDDAVSAAGQLGQGVGSHTPSVCTRSAAWKVNPGTLRRWCLPLRFLAATKPLERRVWKGALGRGVRVLGRNCDPCGRDPYRERQHPRRTPRFWHGWFALSATQPCQKQWGDGGWGTIGPRGGRFHAAAL